MAVKHFGLHKLHRLDNVELRVIADAEEGIQRMEQSELDVIELNEAFAAQALAVIRAVGLDEDKVNPMGGAIAYGHPIGATGAMLCSNPWITCGMLCTRIL